MRTNFLKYYWKDKSYTSSCAYDDTVSKNSQISSFFFLQILLSDKVFARYLWYNNSMQKTSLCS